MRDFTFESGPRRLSATLFSPTERAPSGAGILFVHGSGSDRSGYGERATAASERLGATCLTFDLSGHGESGGSRAELSLRDHLDDCRNAFDRLASEPGVDPARIGICAASYGAYLGAMLVALRRVRSLLLRAPALYADSELDAVGGPLRSNPEVTDTPAALEALADYTRPVLVLESEHDELIPHAIVEAYLSACRDGRHRVLAGAGHSLSEQRWRDEFVAIIVDWFGETLKG